MKNKQIINITIHRRDKAYQVHALGLEFINKDLAYIMQKISYHAIKKLKGVRKHDL
jgi:hypothetical protein